MDLVRRIEIFTRVADAGSFARAATRLSLTPSAVSRAISELEKQLRIVVFYRTTRHLRLTEDGEELYRRGTEIVDRLGELETALSRSPNRLTGTLRIGVSVNLTRYILMPGLVTFMNRHPDLRLDLSVVSEPKEMHAEGVDVLLRVGDPPDSALIARKMAELRFGLYASPEYLRANGSPSEPEDLRRHRCVVHRPPNFARPLDEWIFERGDERRVLVIRPALATNDREALIAAVVGGAGVMRIGMFDPALVTSGRLRRLLPEWACPGGQAIYAIYRKTAQLAPKIAAFLAFADEAFAAFDPAEVTLSHPARGRAATRSPSNVRRPASPIR